MTVRGIRAAARLMLVTAAVVTATLAATAAPAAAAPTRMLLSSDGVSFGPTLSGELFDGLGLLVPGDSMSSSLWVRNAGAEAGVMRVVIDDLVVPSPAFASGVTLTVDDGQLTRSVVLEGLQRCSVIVPSRDIPAGGTLRIDLAVAMLDTVTGLDAQDESADLRFEVTMRDAAAGPFPAGDGCATPPLPDTPGGGGLPYTGVDVGIAVGAAAGFLLLGGLLVLVRRRRHDDTEPAR